MPLPLPGNLPLPSSSTNGNIASARRQSFAPASPDLPPGSTVMELPPGTNIVGGGSNFRSSTTSRTNLAEGVYRVQHAELGSWILSVRRDKGPLQDEASHMYVKAKGYSEQAAKIIAASTRTATSSVGEAGEDGGGSTQQEQIDDEVQVVDPLAL